MAVFKDTTSLTIGVGSIYGEEQEVRYRHVDLLWKPIGSLVRFVFVIHPICGNAIFLSTDLTEPITILKIYRLGEKYSVFKSYTET